jgi:hypothetical protein
MSRLIALALLTLFAAVPASARSDAIIGDAAVANQLYAVADDLAGVSDQFASVVYRLQYPNPGPPTVPDPGPPTLPDPGPPTIAFVDQLATIVNELNLLEARILAAYPNPGPPNDAINAALQTVVEQAGLIADYPSPGPPGAELTDVGLAILQVQQAAVDIATLARSLMAPAY